MPIYPIGRCIKESRTRMHFSQEEVCDGICSISTYSKIENGIQNPTRKTLEAIIGRLGMSLAGYNISVTDVEFQRGNIEQRILHSIIKGSFNIKPLLDEYMVCSYAMDNLERQYYLFAEAQYEKHYLKKEQDYFSILTTILRMTIPDFDVKNLGSIKLLALIEFFIIKEIALTCFDDGRRNEAIEIMYFLKQYCESCGMEEEEKRRRYPAVLLDLALFFSNLGNYKTAYELADEGMRCYLQYDDCLTQMQQLLYIKGISCSENGDLPTGKKLLMQAFAVYLLMGKGNAVKHLIKKANLDYGYGFRINDGSVMC